VTNQFFWEGYGFRYGAVEQRSSGAEDYEDYEDEEDEDEDVS
jgi:hypothetical protein